MIMERISEEVEDGNALGPHSDLNASTPGHNSHENDSGVELRNPQNAQKLQVSQSLTHFTLDAFIVMLF